MSVTKSLSRFAICLILGLSINNAVIAENTPVGKSPILVVTDRGNSANPFGGYLAEILLGEGFVQFDLVDRSDAKSMPDAAERLADYQAVILAEMELDANEEGLLREYVKGGGVLIAMRPDAGLAGLFGIRVEGKRPEQLLQYFAVAADLPKEPCLPAGMGIVAEPLQYHGEADNYKLNGAKPLAFLCADADTPSQNPAVTLHRFGKGCAVAFAFDLAKSIVLMRQGNPEWQNTEGDGTPQYRPMDLFFRTDGQKYIDLKRLKIPQADESQRLLANIIMSLTERPLPRIWYLPKTHKMLVVNTGDAEDWFEEQLDPAFDECAKYGGYYTAYLRNSGIAGTTPKKEAAWRKAGHEVGVHVWAGGKDGAGAGDALDKAYGKIVGDLKSKFGHGSRTARSHTIDWTGWVEMAAIEAKNGTGMDTNYYHYLNTANTMDTNGYFNGTGLPQRFMDADGKLLPIYQATTHWSDEWFADKKLTVEQTVDIMKKMLEAAENGFYSAFVNNIHQGRHAGIPGVDEITPVWCGIIWKHCQDKGIPSWSCEMLLDFVEARNAARFENLAWKTGPAMQKSELAFDFHAPRPGQDLTVMIPAEWSGRKLQSVRADGKPVELRIERIKGIGYAMFTTNRLRTNIVANYKMP